MRRGSMLLRFKVKNVRAVTYSRVSTADKQNPEAQASEMRRYCSVREWKVELEIADKGFSGGTGLGERPGLDRLIAMARARQIDVIVVTKLDRLFRSLRHLVAVLDEIHELGVLFVSIYDHIDLSTASGRLMLHLLGAFGEFERALIRERTMVGLAYAKSRGKRLGRPKTCDDDEIVRLRREGFSYTEIQKRLGISRPSIRRAIVAGDISTKTLFSSPTKNSIKSGKSDV
jgi:DNA invertase Pin-like site-specific DNA recombinase